ncbi:MAG: cyclic-di-AMP receptor [bacterium]
MKLIIIITPSSESARLEKTFRQATITFTKLESRSGIMQKKNNTLLVGVNDEKVENTLSLIDKCCSGKSATKSIPPAESLEPGDFQAIEKASKRRIDGAVVFIVPLEKMLKF